MGLVTKHSTTDYCRAPLQVARLRTGAKDQRPRCDTRVHAPALCTSTERQRDDLRRPLVFENRRLLLPAMKSALCGSARCGAKRCVPPRRARHAAAEGVPHPPRTPLDTPRDDSSQSSTSYDIEVVAAATRASIFTWSPKYVIVVCSAIFFPTRISRKARGNARTS